jgi:hypothetical protein
MVNETEEHFTDPYLHRLRGECLLKRKPRNSAPAEEAFQTSIAVAKQQGARSYERRLRKCPKSTMLRRCSSRREGRKAAVAGGTKAS